MTGRRIPNVPRRALQRVPAQNIPSPPPYGGWNTIAPLAAMPPQDAILLDNYFPALGSVKLRKGYRVHTTGGMGGDQVDTLAEWAGSASRKLIGCANGNIYNCSTFNTTASSLASGYTSDRWQTVMFRGSLHFANGADAPQAFDGTSISAPAWTGPTLTTLIHVNIYRSRMYFVEKESFSVWYGGVNAVSGALTEFDMQSLFKKGGQLSFMATWTRDSGQGMDDLAVFVSDQGELLVYQGAYPNDSTWSLIGRFETLRPVSRRSYVGLGADVLVSTYGGIIPLTAVMHYGLGEQTNYSISKKIDGILPETTAVYGANFGWEMLIYPNGDYGLINVPLAVGANAQSWQFVWNTSTGAWCRFKGQNALTWTLYNDRPYFGTASGTVMQADYGSSDGSTGALEIDGSAIMADVQGAYHAYGSPGRLKRFLNIQPLVATNNDLTLSLEMFVDYRNRFLDAVASSSAGGAIWDVAAWDDEDWSDATVTGNAWYGASGVGHVGSIRMASLTTSNEIEIQGFNVIFEPGGLW
jgi:hypothetical protein